MKAIPLYLFLIFLGTANLSAAPGTEPARSFVQATILGSNPAKATLTFLDASGRERVERATGEAEAALAAVLPVEQASHAHSTECGMSDVNNLIVHDQAPPCTDT